jgi:hypothetical protein
LRFPLISKRQKYRNVNSHPQVAASIATSSDASSRFVRSRCMKLGQLPAQILWTRAISLGVVGVGDMASQMIPHLVGALS